MERAKLRKIVASRYSRFTGRHTEVHCILCDEPKKAWDLHEALVAKSAVVREKQDLIFCVENCVPICRECHDRDGQTGATARIALTAIAKRITARRVGKWYTSLWDDHGLSVNKGVLVPVKLVKVHEAITKLIPLGVEVTGGRFPDNGWMINPNTQYAVDFRALCVYSWQGRARIKEMRPPAEWNGVSKDDVVLAVREGYWMNYLIGTLNL